MATVWLGSEWSGKYDSAGNLLPLPPTVAFGKEEEALEWKNAAPGRHLLPVRPEGKAPGFDFRDMPALSAGHTDAPAETPVQIRKFAAIAGEIAIHLKHWQANFVGERLATLLESIQKWTITVDVGSLGRQELLAHGWLPWNEESGLLLAPAYWKFPDGVELTSIGGAKAITPDFDRDTRIGVFAFGLIPSKP